MFGNFIDGNAVWRLVLEGEILQNCGNLSKSMQRYMYSSKCFSLVNIEFKHTLMKINIFFLLPLKNTIIIIIVKKF